MAEFKKGDVVRVVRARNSGGYLLGRLAVVSGFMPNVHNEVLVLKFEDRTRYCSADRVEAVEPVVGEIYRAEQNCPF